MLVREEGLLWNMNCFHLPFSHSYVLLRYNKRTAHPICICIFSIGVRKSALLGAWIMALFLSWFPAFPQWRTLTGQVGGLHVPNLLRSVTDSWWVCWTPLEPVRGVMHHFQSTITQLFIPFPNIFFQRRILHTMEILFLLLL